MFKKSVRTFKRKRNDAAIPASTEGKVEALQRSVGGLEKKLKAELAQREKKQITWNIVEENTNITPAGSPYIKVLTVIDPGVDDGARIGNKITVNSVFYKLSFYLRALSTGGTITVEQSIGIFRVMLLQAKRDTSSDSALPVDADASIDQNDFWILMDDLIVLGVGSFNTTAGTRSSNGRAISGKVLPIKRDIEYSSADATAEHTTPLYLYIVGSNEGSTSVGLGGFVQVHYFDT